LALHNLRDHADQPPSDEHAGRGRHGRNAPDDPVVGRSSACPTNKRWRSSMLADELIDAGQPLPDRTVSAAREVRQWLPQVRLRRLQIDPSPRRYDYTPE
jgi:hypothetical protein